MICVLCALILPAASAQSVGIGAKIGGGPAFLSGSDHRDFLDLMNGYNEVRFGFTAGAFLNFETAEWCSVQAELMYSLAGGALSYYDPDYSDNVDWKITASALELPVLLMLKPRAGKGEIRIFAGPDLIFILGDIEYEVRTLGLIFSIDIEPDNRFVFGLKGGIGYAHPLGKGELVVDFCYTRSLTEIFIDDNTAINVPMLTVGYQIGF
ncbi:MAG TPA: porin family protein [Spirochaetia bacterium]|nr:porin family protein [Spirochaetia bacterium]